MRVRNFAITAFSATLAIMPASRAAADADALVGGIVGGIIGGAIVNNAQRNRPVTRQSTKRTVPRSSGISAATRATNRETQTALNYFGFDAGPADGVIGRGSRAAIARYQAHLSYPATGDLTPYERDFLVTSYQRAMAGGAVTAQMIASNPMGAKGLLVTFRDQALGLPSAQTPPAASAPAVMAAVPEAAPAPAAEPEPAAGLALPNFIGADIAAASLASHCNKVSLMTSTNGGFVTAASMTDPAVALNEQFCLARTYAIADGEDLAGKVQGFTPQQIAAQCQGFGPVLRDHVAALSLRPLPEVLQGVSGFVLESGMSPAQLGGTARICLSVGYRTDDMDVAIGSALILAALGERAYGELLGHHLAQGFGAAERPDLALAWYEMGFDAAAQGGRQVVAPGQPERTELLRKAAYAVGGRAEAAPAAEAAPQAAALPLFEVQQ